MLGLSPPPRRQAATLAGRAVTAKLHLSIRVLSETDRKVSNVRPAAFQERRSPHGQMEREPPQARDLRMAGVRHVRDRDRHGRGSEDDRRPEQQRGPGAPRRPDPRAGRLHHVRPVDRVRVDREPQAHDPRPRVSGGRPRRRARGLAVQESDPQPPLAARPREQRSGHPRRPHRGRRMGHERDAQVRREPNRPADERRRLGGEGPPALLRRRGGRRQLGQGAQQDVQPAARAGRHALGPAHAADPRARVRIAGGGVGPADARAPVGGRDDRTGGDRQPPRPDGPERGRGRDARRTRRRRRLHAVLPPARTGGARRGCW